MKSISRTLTFYFRYYPKSTIIVIALLFVSGLVEAFGVAAFLPFLQIFVQGQDQVASIPYEPLDRFLKQQGIAINFVTLSIFICLMILGKSLVLWVAMRKVGRTVAQISTDFRDNYLKSLLCADWRFFSHHSLGEILNTVSTETHRGALTFVSLTRFMAYLIQFFVYLGGAVLLNWKVSLGIICIGIVTAFLLKAFVRLAREAGENETNTIKSMMVDMADILQGIKPLRAMSLEKKFAEALREYSDRMKDARVKQLVSMQSLRIFHEPIMVISAIAGIYLIVSLKGLGSAELILMMVMFMRIMSGLNAAQTEYQRLGADESALWSLVAAQKGVDGARESDTGGLESPSRISHISFKDVSFSFGQKRIFDNRSMEFSKGKFSVIVGESGSGKTTVLDMLSGFYRPEKGSILIEGTDLKDIQLGSWRRRIGFVPQETFLFNDTIRNNIVMGRESIGDDDVWEAIRAAGAEDFIRKLPDGIYASVGENGRKLSGGQRQRISIARAIVSHPDLLLLDEATSALDADTEKNLLETFKKLSCQMIVVMVTHNLVVKNYADDIYEVSSGTSV